MENIAVGSFQILYIFVLHAEKVTIFAAKMLNFFSRVMQTYAKVVNFIRLYTFRILQLYFIKKLCS